MDTIDRRVIEATKKSPYIGVTIEFGDGPQEFIYKDKQFSHDVGIAIQSLLLRKLKHQNNG